MGKFRQKFSKMLPHLASAMQKNNVQNNEKISNNIFEDGQKQNMETYV
jgi:hypothetical protein